jgi:hypothetical protein
MMMMMMIMSIWLHQHFKYRAAWHSSIASFIHILVAKPLAILTGIFWWFSSVTPGKIHELFLY